MQSIRKITMKIFTALTALLLSAGIAVAGSNADSTRTKFTDRSDMELQMRGSFVVEMPQGSKPQARFRMDNFRWNIEGTAGKNIYYRFRQSFNAAFDRNVLENMLASVNYALVTWKPSERLSFTAGKNLFTLGGHEFYASTVNVIEFSDFGSSLHAYQMGLTAKWQINDRQELLLQMANINGTGDAKRYYGGLPDGVSSTGAPFLYSLNWNSFFCRNNALELRYSASYGQQAKDRSISIFSLGQAYRRRTWGAYLDLYYSRQGLDANGLISSTASFPDGTARTMQNVEYFCAVAYLHFFISPSFCAFLKGTGETGGLYRKDGEAAPGLYRFNWNTQACFQYMPTKDRNFRLFAHYSYYSRHSTAHGRDIGIASLDRQTVTAGIIYIMKIF